MSEPTSGGAPSGVPSVWAARIGAELDRIVAEGRWRRPREFDALGPRGILGGSGSGAEVVSFASNDYLGLSAHPAVVRAAHEALDRWGAGSGASRLVTGSRPIHGDLETALARWKGTEAAVCFSTGFAANLGALTTLAGPGVRVLSDELNHASIIDGCRLSRGALSVYRHRDMDHLAQLLVEPAEPESPEGSRGSVPTLVVSDAVFSMDGDLAPVDDLVRLCTEHGALLVLDEAHAVRAPDGDRHLGALGVVRVGTLSKSLGSLGGFVAASRGVVDLLINRARSYIFSTAPTPADTAAALAALDVMRSSEGAALRARLDSLIALFSAAGLAPAGHPSPIIPVVLGSEDAAVEASEELLAQGLWVPAIRPPTVPVGTSRLRITLSARHAENDVERLIEALGTMACRERMIR